MTSAAKAEALWELVREQNTQAISRLWQDERFKAAVQPLLSDEQSALLFSLPDLEKHLIRSKVPIAERAHVLDSLAELQRVIGAWILADQETRGKLEARMAIESKAIDAEVPEGEISQRLADYRAMMADLRAEHRTWLVNLVAGPSHTRQRKLLSVEQRIRNQCQKIGLTETETQALLREVTRVCAEVSCKAQDLRNNARLWKPTRRSLVKYQQGFSSVASRLKRLVPRDTTRARESKRWISDVVDALQSINGSRSISFQRALRRTILQTASGLSKILQAACPTETLANTFSAELLTCWLRGAPGPTRDDIKTARYFKF